MTAQLPLGFRSHVANIGIKDTTDDFTLVVADGTCSAAGVFTQSRFAGPSVVVSREHIANLSARAVVVISKNANVATGAEGMSNAREIVANVASTLNCATTEVLIASTGVIGRQYPMTNVRMGLTSIPQPCSETSADAVARGIMTTDTVSKVAQATVSGSSSRVVGVAKGVGMIEPNMATLITMIFTDALIAPADLDRALERRERTVGIARERLAAGEVVVDGRVFARLDEQRRERRVFPAQLPPGVPDRRVNAPAERERVAA